MTWGSARVTLQSGVFSMRPTSIVPIKLFLISGFITPTRFFTKSRLQDKLIP